MSRNFEMMQQAVTVREIPSVPRPETIFPDIDLDKNSRNHADLNLDQLAQEEALKLIQRVFLAPQTTEAPHVVVFAGIDRGSGCSLICAQAARILASNVPGPVCLVEANFRSPSLPEFFGVSNHRGLTNALLSDDPIVGFAKRLQPDNFWLLSSGALASDSPNLLNSDHLRARFAELREEFEYVLIDVPPLNQYADATALGKIADGLVLVLEANSTRRESALKGVETLQAARIRVLGAVLNKRTFPIPNSLYRRL
jgi:Mrp family chromosome partitioning ATPase